MKCGMKITEYTTALTVFTCNSMCKFMAYHTRKSGTPWFEFTNKIFN